MQITQKFRVARPAADVWAAFHDIPSVVECLPGASLTEIREDGSYSGLMRVKLGPISASFEGTAHITFDSEALRGVIEAAGVDRRGGSRGSASVTFAVTDEEGATEVEIDSHVTISGTIAQFARAGLVTEVTSRMMRDFAGCLEAKLAATSPEEAAAVRVDDIDGVSLLLQSGSSWVKHRLRRDHG